MTQQWHGGKGSAPRKDADQKKYADNWEKIFGKNKPSHDAKEIFQTGTIRKEDTLLRRNIIAICTRYF